MKLTHREIIDLAAAHKNLDGVGETVYKFNPKVRYQFAQNLRRLRSRAEDINAVRQGIVRELVPDGNVPPEGDPVHIIYEKRWGDFLAESEDVNLARFTLGDLNLDVNSIPVSVLSNLAQVIIEEDAP